MIPFKKFCENTNQVLSLIEKVFKDIEAQKDLSEFKIAKEMNKGVGRAIVDSIILEPNFSGIGFSFNKLKRLPKVNRFDYFDYFVYFIYICGCNQTVNRSKYGTIS